MTHKKIKPHRVAIDLGLVIVLAGLLLMPFGIMGLSGFKTPSSVNSTNAQPGVAGIATQKSDNSPTLSDTSQNENVITEEEYQQMLIEEALLEYSEDSTAPSFTIIN